MVFNPASWVNDSVRACIADLEQSPLNYSETERELWRRMATDPRMEGVFSSKYLAKRLTQHGWCIWFGHACGVDTIAIREERERLKEYALLMAEANEILIRASSIFSQIKELDVDEVNFPRVMLDPILLIEESVENACERGDRRLSYFFGMDIIKPIINKIKGFDKRSLPSVPQMITTLSDHVFFAAKRLERGQITPGCPIMAAALSSRQHAPVPEYIRSFDAAMRDYERDTNPPKLRHSAVFLTHGLVRFSAGTSWF